MAQVERAIALGLEGTDAQIALSQARRVQRRFAEGLEAAERAVELGPSDVFAWHNLSLGQLCCGLCKAALESAERAIDLDPLPNPWALMNLSAALWANRRHDEAIRLATESLLRVPDLWFPQAQRMYALYESGRIAEARTDAARLLVRLPRLSAEKLTLQFADDVFELRERVIAAARGSGMP